MKREELEKMLPLLRPWLGRAGADSLVLACQLRACLALEGLEESGCGLAPWSGGSLESLVGAALERAGEICDAGEAARLLYAAMDASFNSERLGERYVEQCRELSERVIERFLEERRYAGDEEAERSVFRLIVLNIYGVGGPDGEVHAEWRPFLDSLLERWSAESMGSPLWPGLNGEQRLRRHTAMLEAAYMLGDSRYSGLLERSYGELVCGAELPSSGGGSLSGSSSVSFSGAESGGGTDFGYLSALYDAALDGTDGLMPDLAMMDAVAGFCDEFVLGSFASVFVRGPALVESGSDMAGTGIPAFAPSAGQAQALAVSVPHCCWQLSRQADEEFDRSF